MSKYTSYRKELPAKSYEPHPVWRGIGCVIMLLLPPISYVLSMLTVEFGIKQGIRIPDSLAGYPVMPEILFRVPGLVDLLYWIQSLHNLYAILVVAFFFLVILAGVLSLVNAILYRVAGPPQYSEFDAPPPNRKVKKYRR